MKLPGQHRVLLLSWQALCCALQEAASPQAVRARGYMLPRYSLAAHHLLRNVARGEVAVACGCSLWGEGKKNVRVVEAVMCVCVCV